MKAKLALLEASPSSSQNPKTFQPKNKCLVAETFDWDEEEVFDDEKVTHVKVLMALADDELTVRKSHARNGEYVDITIRKVNTLLSMDEDADWQNYLKYINIDFEFVEDQRLNLLSKYNKMVFELNKCRDELLILKQARLDVVTFQIQNTELTKLNHALQEQLKEEKKINEKWLTSSKKVSQCISEQIPHKKKKVLGGELFTESSSKINENKNLFVPASMGYDQKMVPKTKYWVERLNPDSKLLNFNTGRILVPERASPSSEVMPLTFQPHSSKERLSLGIIKPTKLETHDSLDKSVSGTVTISETKPTTPLVPTEVKNTKQESKINKLTKLVQMLTDEKVNSTQMTQESNLQIQQTESSKSVDSSKISQDSKPKVQNVGSSKSLRPKPIQKPQLKCELCHYTNHLTNDCYRIIYCMICKRKDHGTSNHEMYTASLKRSKKYKAQPYQYASSSKQIMKAKAKPFPPCTHCGFNDHKLGDCKNYPECGICRNYDHFTLRHNHVIHIRGGMLAESSQTKKIKYAPQWNNMTVDNVTFQTNNVVGNFNYPPNMPAYKPIMKFSLNFPLNKAFTSYPSVVYYNFLGELWSIVVAYDPFPSTDETEQYPLMEFLVKFSVLNGQRPLTLDFNTICSLTGLDCNNGKYVAYPTLKAVKKELGKIAINPSYMDKTLVLKNSFLVAWRILFTFVIQVLCRNYSSTEQVNFIQQLLVYCLITRTKVDIWEIIYSDIVTKLLNNSRLKYVSYLRFISCALQVLLGFDYTQDENFSPYDCCKQLEGFSVSTSFACKAKEREISDCDSNLTKSQGLEASEALFKMRQKPKSKKPPTKTKGLPSTLDEGTRKSQHLPESTTINPKDSVGNKQPIDIGPPSMNSDEGTTKTMPRPKGSLGDKNSGGNISLADMEPIHPTVADLSLTGANDEEEVLAAGKDMDEDPQVAEEVRTPSPKQDQPEPSHQSPMLTSRPPLKNTMMKMLITEIKADKMLLKEINYAVRDDPATNKKIDEAIETFDKISTNTIKTAFKHEVSSLRQDTSKIKSMITEIYLAFKGQSSSAPSSSVIQTLALTNIPSNVKGDNATNTTTKEPPSHTEGETEDPKKAIPITLIQPTKVPPTQAQPLTTITTHPESSQAALRIDKGKGIATESDEDPSKKLVPASTIVRLNPDEEVKVLYMINGKMCYLTDTEMQGYLDKEEKLRKAVNEARLLAISKPELIKVVQEEAEKIGLDPKKIASAKAGKKFKKAQDAEHQVLKREHSQKVKRLTELNKKRAEQYMWTMTNRIKPEPITDVKIHPNTKPDVFFVYRNNDKRNFNVHNPYKFTNFGITELEEWGLIIQKKKNSIIKDLMTSLSKRYERLKKISKELRIQYALPAPVKVHGLECNWSLPEGVPFVNNMVIEEPEHGIFFTDVFGDQAFQRWNDIQKVRVDSLVLYMVMALMVKTIENARFFLKLRKLIADHPDQEKLKSKRVKLEALGYQMD
nr:retrovirus-related Pol polyprotein from transposon TNT 1-94 [Tanacetum cinerariifolium]